MMTPVYAVASNIVSSLGIDMSAHRHSAMIKQSGIRQYEDAALSENGFYASRIDSAVWQHIHSSTRTHVSLSPFEQMALFSARKALQELEEPIDLSKTVLILSSTKGNIEWLNQKDDSRILLTDSASIIAKELGIPNKPLIISQACISGIVALIYALRLLQSDRYEHAIAVGADRLTQFVLSGFQSFKAVDEKPCRPFDKERMGVNLGEAAATIILSAHSGQALAQLISGATTNDANHISGPSRTGEELATAITQSLQYANISASQIDIVSAHGTATPYNDEMEAKAFALASVNNAPVHSFKSFVGHTLGAAGIVESAMLIEALRNQHTLPSLGYREHGVTQPLNVSTEATPASLQYALKTASGFGGCNAAAVWKYTG